MDLQSDVEAFRTMLKQYGVVSPDGSEAVLEDLLCSDLSAVTLFSSCFLDQPKTLEDQLIWMRWSTYERNTNFQRELVMLSLYAQYLSAGKKKHGYAACVSNIAAAGYAAFRRYDYYFIREILLFDTLQSGQSASSDESLGRNVPAILRKRSGFHN